MSLERFNETVQVIDEKLGGFRGAGTLADWYFHAGDTEEIFAEEINPENWSTVNAGHTWSSAMGNMWFRKDAKLPAEVNGISLVGQPIDIIFFMPIGATLFLNGKQIYDEPFWADTRAFLVRVTDSFDPNERLSLAIKAKSGDGFGLFLGGWFFISLLDKAAFQLELFREQLKFCKHLMDKKESKVADEARAFDAALASLNLDAIRANQWDAWAESAKSAVDSLMVFDDEAKTYEVDLVAHSHIDMNWLWTMQETIDVCYRDFSTMNKLMETYPQFHFSQSQAATYELMEKHHPEVFKAIQERVKDGHWDITANTWVEGDLNTALGETLVRQILHTRRYVEEKLGVTPKICWEPDTFGHPATYPQILAKSGIEYYYFCRAGKGHPIFWWEAPDGSKVLALNDFTGYGGEVFPTSLTYIATLFEEKSKVKNSLWVYGAGDHGGAATARDIEMGMAFDAAPVLPKATMVGTPAFYEKIQNTGVEYPVVQDELNTVFEGCYSSHGDIKRLNRFGENSLLTSETVAALASLNDDYAYPVDTFAEAWKNQCFHQFHDILCGCSIGSTYRQAAEALRPSHDALLAAIDESLSRLARRVDTGSGNKKIVVFNQLAWTRDDLVRIEADGIGIDGCCVQDEVGNKAPVQILDGKLTFVAKGVPALGCKVYELVKGDLCDAPKLVADAASNTLENSYLRMRVNPGSGCIESLVMVDSGRDIAGPAAGWGPEGKVSAGTLNRFMVYFEQPHPMSAWNIGETTQILSLISGAEAKVVESGPVCAAIEVKHKFLNSGLTQQIRLYNGLDRIDFVTEVDWHEQGTATTDAPMLKTTFTPYFGDSKVNYEIPYGAIERTAHGREVPALRWADISEENCGLSLMNNCKHGHHAQGNTLALTLVRASYEPDNNPDEGLHKFIYSIYPHQGTWKDARTQWMGAELNQPLLATVTDGHTGSITPGKPFIACSEDNVVISAVKFAEDQPSDSAAMIVRLYESKGTPVTAQLSVEWPILKAESVNMIEQPEGALTVDGNTLTLDFGKAEIKTIKLYLKK